MCSVAWVIGFNKVASRPIFPVFSIPNKAFEASLKLLVLLFVHYKVPMTKEGFLRTINEIYLTLDADFKGTNRH